MAVSFSVAPCGILLFLPPTRNSCVHVSNRFVTFLSIQNASHPTLSQALTLPSATQLPLKNHQNYLDGADNHHLPQLTAPRRRAIKKDETANDSSFSFRRNIRYPILPAHTRFHRSATSRLHDDIAVLVIVNGSRSRLSSLVFQIQISVLGKNAARRNSGARPANAFPATQKG
jgi:hypothetical protein